MVCIITAANSHCPSDSGWPGAAVVIAIIVAITAYKLAKLWLDKE